MTSKDGIGKSLAKQKVYKGEESNIQDGSMSQQAV